MNKYKLDNNNKEIHLEIEVHEVDHITVVLM